MKKIAALVLAALLALTAFSAGAENYTLEEKFFQQAFKESAYRGTITFSVTGDGSAAIPGEIWLALKTLAPQMSLTLEHSTTAGRDEGQGAVSLLMNGQPRGTTTFLYDDRLVAFSSALLGSESNYYSAARDWDLTALAESAVSSGSAWPPVWRLVWAIETAPEAWKARAQERLDLFQTKVGLWLNGYAAYATGTENGVGYSELSCTIPPQAVKAEIQQLMVDLYSDAELLSLLRELATPQEAAAYLQPSMMNALFSMINGLAISGDVSVVRRYDATGNALLDKISLPFAAGSALENVTVSVVPAQGGKRAAVSGENADGVSFEVSFAQGEEGVYTGSVRYTRPEAENDSFVVADGGAQRTVSFDYSLVWEPGEDVYDLETDRFSRTIKGSVLIRPQQGGGIPEQSLTLELLLSSRSSTRAATQLNGTLTWHDLDSDAAITAALESRTVSPFAYTTPSSLSGALRVDLLTDESRAALTRGWLANAGLYFVSLLQGAVPAAPIATVQPR